MSNQINNTSSADNVAAINRQADIKTEAGTWLVRMDQGALSAKDKQALQAWAAQSEFHSHYLQKLAGNWDAMDILQEMSALFPLPEHEAAAAQATPFLQSLVARMQQLWRGPWIAGSVAAVCALVAVLLLPLFSLQQTYATAVGEQAMHVLADGTEIVLNTNSKIDVDYRDGKRVVRLSRGEVNFDVAKNPQRPFLVYAGDGLVWAVGTAFNVRKGRDAVDVTVTEGRVKVIARLEAATPLPSLLVDTLSSTQGAATQTDVMTDPKVPSTQEAFLVAGDVLSFDQRITAREHMAQAELDQKLAWKKGALIFEGETLEQVLAEVSRYTQKEIVIIDPAIRALRIGGHFKVNDIDGLLHTLSQGFGIKVSYISDSKIHLSAKQKKSITRS